MRTVNAIVTLSPYCYFPALQSINVALFCILVLLFDIILYSHFYFYFLGCTRNFWRRM